MGRLALLNWFLFMFLRPRVSNLARASRLKVCVCVCVCAWEHSGVQGNSNWQESKKVENQTCRLPDVSVKAVSAAAAQVHGEVSEACSCITGSRQDPGPLSCWTPGFLAACTAVHLHMYRVQLCSVLLFMFHVVRFCLLLNNCAESPLW